MSRIWPSRIAVAALLLSVLLLASFLSIRGQGLPIVSSDRAPTLKTSTTLVLAPTLVRSPAGDLVQGLSASDFRLTDNGVPQQVAVEDVERQPVSVVVLMQTGGAAARQFSNYGNLGTMLDALTGASRRRIALMTFDSQPEDQWDFTPDVSTLADGFLHPVAGDGGAAIVDAVDFGIGLLKQEPANSRRVLILLSQTQDAGSRTSREEVVRRLGESNVTIYSVAFSVEKTWLKDQFTKPRHGNPPYQMSPDHPPLIYTFNLSTPLGVAMRAMQTNVAAEIASLSGGEYMEFGDRRDLERRLGAVANHVPNRYTLSFRPTSDQLGFHALAVEVLHHEGAQVSTRTGYWAAASAGH